jgi:subtilisin family serine protease
MLACSALASAADPADARLDVLARSRKLGADVVASLRREPFVRAIVYFESGAARGTAADRARMRSVADELEREARAGGRLRVHRRFARLHGIAVEVDPGALGRLAAHPAVLRVDRELPGGGSLDQARPLAGIDAVQAMALEGAGVKVAVLDSGVSSGHADLAGATVAEACFCSGGCCPSGASQQVGPGAAEDDHGHGTHVAGILTGDGAVAPRGVATASGLVAVKVLDRFNRFCCISDIAAGLDWVLDNQPDTAIVNLSLATDATFAGDCDGANANTLLLADAVQQLREVGTLVVAASGNQRATTAMALPACLRDVLAVGAVWDSAVGTQSVFGCTETTAADKPTCFSNSSATTDLFAPGAPTTATGIGGASATFHGTSQAAALVSGCAALLREFAPAAPLAAQEAALRTSPVWITVAASGRSFPRLDCAAALAQLGAAVPALPRVAFAAGVVVLGLLGACAARRAARLLH